MRQTYDKEKVSLNLARLKTHGENFEVVIDPDNAVKFRHGQGDIREALKAEHIYKDAVKGELASEQHMNNIFKTASPLKIAEKIIKEGSIQVSDEYRDNLRNEKKKVITEILISNGADANTGMPLTATRINNAFHEAKVHVDIFKKAEDQVEEIVEKLRPVLPLTFEKKILDLRLPPAYAAKLYGFVNNQSRILDQAWLSDGSWSCKTELAAGMVLGFLDELKSKTHGDVEVKVESKKEDKKK
ncbi:ribosome assembly factor SBDS [Candidatus Woesearchaeota archaeon]|nr:ribosome assembly factor SBDS [Candidatus Woesearchaeota archaeon]